LLSARTVDWVKAVERREVAAAAVVNEVLPNVHNLKVNKVTAECLVRRGQVVNGYQSWEDSGLYRITIDCQVVPPQRSAEEIGGIQGEVGPSGPKAQQVAESEVGE
jgi:hypothetical protein